MKKFLYTVAVLLVAGLIIHNFTNKEVEPEDVVRERLEENISMYPVYAQLDEEDKEIYVDICAAIENYEEYVGFGIYGNSDEAQEASDKYSEMITNIIYEQAEYFWVKLGGMTKKYSVDGSNTIEVCYEPIYIMEKDEYLEKKEEYDSAVESIVFMADLQPTLFDKVLYVHDYILENAEYDYELYEENVDHYLGYTAYGCIVEGKSVCTGYTLAFSSIMRRLGIECGYECDILGMSRILKNGHIWNYCKLDGEYYYFDLTWDDTKFDSDVYKPYLDYCYTYFGITKEELKKTHNLSKDAITPECNGTMYNYYVYNGYNIDEYDFSKVEYAMLNQSAKRCITLRFGNSNEVKKAVANLVDDNGFYSVFPDTTGYRYVTDDYHLYFLME